MFVCFDVDYRDSHAQVAAIVFEDLKSDKTILETTVEVKDIHPYVSGEFFKRELPCLLAIWERVKHYPIEAIIVDSYVYLDKDVPGMGHHLFEALNKKIPVIGVAKTRFKMEENSIQVLRGDSNTPLYVTSIGTDDIHAAIQIATMHGKYRIPTLLKKVDQLSRRE